MPSITTPPKTPPTTAPTGKEVFPELVLEAVLAGGGTKSGLSKERDLVSYAFQLKNVLRLRSLAIFCAAVTSNPWPVQVSAVERNDILSPLCISIV